MSAVEKYSPAIRVGMIPLAQLEGTYQRQPCEAAMAD